MQYKSLAKRRQSDIEAAIQRAKEYAQAQDVPLTAERLAAELDMDLAELHRVAHEEVACTSASARRKVALIRRACGEATASVVEHAMRRGSSANMHMLYLKNNAGYDRPAEEKQGGDTPPVVFIGEENIGD